MYNDFVTSLWYLNLTMSAPASPKNISTSRVPDPDPDWIRIQSGQWIRIRILKNDPQK